MSKIAQLEKILIALRQNLSSDSSPDYVLQLDEALQIIAELKAQNRILNTIEVTSKLAALGDLLLKLFSSS